jgi:nucleotide-binding universal stress UspA family protein
MVALDEAEEWHIIAERAAEIARRFDAPLTLLHVVDQRALSAGGEADVPLFGMSRSETEEQAERALTEPQPVPFSTDDRLMAQGHRFLAAVTEHLREGRAPGAEVVASSSVAAEVVATARRLEADLLVCGAHHRSGLALFSSSATDRVVHHLPCDVLLVRLP